MIMTETLRLFIGGLPKDINNEELAERFNKYGKVLATDIKSKTDASGEWLKTFGYININIDEKSLQRCRNQLNNSLWKGGKLCIQLAKQDTIDKYAEERQNLQQKPDKVVESSEQKTAPSELRGAVPGTLHPERENWVVTKYQRVMPVMNIRSKDRKKVIKYDPSKHCHQIKKLDTEKETAKKNGPDLSVAELTWQMDDVTPQQETHLSKLNGLSSSKITKKRKIGRSAEEIIKEEKAKHMKLMADDDMEIVPTQQVVKQNGSNKSSTAHSKAGVDLSRFDSDSDTDEDRKLVSNNDLKALNGHSVPNDPVANRREKTTSKSDSKAENATTTPKTMSASQLSSKSVTKHHSPSRGKADSSTSSSSDSDSSSSEEDEITKMKNTPASKKPTSISASTKGVSKTKSEQVLMSSNSSSSSTDTEDETPTSKATTEKSNRNQGSSKSLTKSEIIGRGKADSSTCSSSDSDSSNSEEDEPTKTKHTPASIKTSSVSATKKGLSKATRKQAALSSSSSNSTDSDDEESTSTVTTEKVSIKQPTIQQADKPTTRTESEISSSESECETPQAGQSVTETASAHNPNLNKISKAEAILKNESTTTQQTKTEGKKKLSKAERQVAKASRERGYLTAAEKHKLSNAKRIEAMKQKSSEMSYQQNIIKESLKNPDAASSKKIVFDSDSDDSKAEPVPNQATDMKHKEQKAAADTNQSLKVLFDDESNDEEDENEDYDKMFSIKPQFEGERGAKLLSLQKNYNQDERFKLTERFLDSDTDSSSESQVEKATPNTDENGDAELDMTEEKRRNLQILQSIVGSNKVKIDHPAAKSSKNKDKKVADTAATVFRSIASMQYDPTDERQSHLLKTIEKPDKTKKEKKRKDKLYGSDPVVADELAPEIEPDRFFEVAIDFKKHTEASTEKKAVFSFLDNDELEKEKEKSISMSFDFLSNNDKAKNESTTDSESDRVEKTVSQKNGTGTLHDVSTKTMTRNDESSSEESESDEETEEEELEKQNTGQTDNQEPLNKTESSMEVDTTETNTVVDWFFFKPEDPRLVDGRNRFYRTMDENKLRENWNLVRPKLVADYILKSKRALRSSTTKKVSAVQKRFATKSKRGKKL